MKKFLIALLLLAAPAWAGNFGGRGGPKPNKYGEIPVELDRYGRDAFGRLRVSSPYTLASHMALVEDRPFIWSTSLAGGGTATHSEAGTKVTLAVPATAGAYAIRQTKRRFLYQPGKSQLAKITFDQFHSETGLTKRVGLMLDAQSTTQAATAPYLPFNGMYFESTTSGIYCVVIGNGFEYFRSEQAAWDDKLDGTGQSGAVIDFTKSQLSVIDYEWLGVGTVRFGFQVGHNEIVYVAKYTHANNYTGVYTKSPNLPIRYEIRSDGTGGGDFTQICSEIESEGGQEPGGRRVEVGLDTGTGFSLGASSADKWQLLFALKFKQGYEGFDINLESLSTLMEGNGNYKYGVFLNPTIAGAVTYVNVTNTALMMATGAAANVITSPSADANTIIIDSGFVTNQSSVQAAQENNIIKMGTSISGVSDVMAVGIMPFDVNKTVTGSAIIRQVP